MVVVRRTRAAALGVDRLAVQLPCCHRWPPSRQWSSSERPAPGSAAAVGTADAEVQPWVKPQFATPELLRQLKEILTQRNREPESQDGVDHWPAVVESSCMDGGLGVVAVCRDPSKPIPAGSIVALYPGAARLHPPVNLPLSVI